MSLAEIGAVATVIISIATAILSILRLKVDNRSSVVTHFKTLVDTYLAEIKRLNDEVEERDKLRTVETSKLKDEIAGMLGKHSQELAFIRAQHIEEMAKLKAEHTQELAGLRVALQELRNMYTGK